MKKLLLGLFALCAFSATAQETLPADSQWKPYLTASYSIANTRSEQFKSDTYFALEAGIQKENLGFYGAIGRGTTAGAFGKYDNLKPYWVSVGTSLNQTVGVVNMYVFAGAGSYIQSNKAFIEYGAGMSTPITKDLALGAKVVNWDGVTYFTPTLTWSL